MPIKISNVVKSFNEYKRLKEADDNGYVKCVTCGHIGSYKKLHSGHFQHGLHFIEENQHIQCPGCNTFGGGKRDLYTLFMIDKYGREKVDELIQLKNKGRRYSQSELKELRTYYRKKVRELRKEKGLY